MNRHTKLLIGVLAIFIVGMTLGVAFAEPVDAKTFKSPSGYKWKIKDSKWKKMKKQAKKNYKWKRQRGGFTPGYSNGVKVTVTKKFTYQSTQSFCTFGRLRCSAWRSRG